MKTAFRAAFQRDLNRIRDRQLLTRVATKIREVEAATDLNEVVALRRLQGSTNRYRIRIGDYRVGLETEGSTVRFVRFLHRRNIYRFFP